MLNYWLLTLLFKTGAIDIQRITWNFKLETWNF